MEPRMTKLQMDFLASIGHRYHEIDDIRERKEIIDRYDIGYLEFQKFLLDYSDLDPLYREQLSLGLPLSSKQASRVYEALQIEDEEQLLSRKELIQTMSIEQRTKLNALTPEARKTVVARLVDGRILGVLDHVLDAAPDLDVNRSRIVEVSGNKLEKRLITYFQKEKASSRRQRVLDHQDEVKTLIQMVDKGLVKEVVLVSVASELLTKVQRDYWRGHTSGKQKRALARHLLEATNQPIEGIPDLHTLPKDIRAHLKLDLPLTDRQLRKIEEIKVERKD